MSRSRKFSVSIASMTVAVAALAVAGCSGGYGSSGGGYGSSGGGSSASSGASSPAASSSGSGASGSGSAMTGSAVLSTTTSGLGRIVVDGQGRTAYVFTKDTPGAGRSACTGSCAANWPPIVTDQAQPRVDGITGKVGTIPAAAGKKQVTLNGMPLYTFVGDHGAGDTSGNGVKDVWYVVSPAGEKIGDESSGSGYNY